MKNQDNKVKTFFDRFDLFAIPVPNFTVEGNDKVGTPIGAFLSLVMVVVVLIYGIPKFIDMAWKQRPNIVEVIDPVGLD